MKKFKDYLKIVNESNDKYLYSDNDIYRIDDKEIKDFKKNLKTYYHSSDWTTSGIFNDESKIPKGYLKSTGLFAADLKNVVPYVSPRGTQFIIYKDKKNKSHVIFNINDKNEIQKHRPILSKFDRQKGNFKKLKNSNEYFSPNPGEAVSQEKINDPIDFIQKSGYIVDFVDDLYEKIKDLEKKNINFDYEGLDI